MRNYKIYNFILILLALCQGLHSLANSAVYIIQNEGTNQCLAAGPVIKYSDDSNKTTLFKQGTALTTPCANNSAMDFGQQWTVRIWKDDSRTGRLQVQLAMLNTQYEDTKLNVKLRGEFISYFPKYVNLSEANHSDTPVAKSNAFIVVDPTNGYCLTDTLESNLVTFSKCLNDSSEIKYQTWSFTLVNEEVQPKREHRKLVNGSLSYDWTVSNTELIRILSPTFSKETSLLKKENNFLIKNEKVHV